MFLRPVEPRQTKSQAIEKQQSRTMDAKMVNKSRRQRRLFCPHLVMIALIAVGGLVAGVHLVRLDHKSYQTAVHTAAHDTGTVLAERLRREVADLELVAQGLVSSISVSPDLSDGEFDLIARRLVRDNRMIKNIALAPDLRVNQVFSDAVSQKVKGLDYREVPAQLAGINMSRRRNATVFTGPVQLVQGGSAFIMRSPVYVPEPEADRQRFWGVVSIVVSQDELFSRAGLMRDNLRIAVRRLTTAGQPGRVLYGDADVFDSRPITHTVSLQSNNWQIGLLPVNGWPTVSPQRINIIAITLAFSLILIASVMISHRLMREREKARDLLTHAVESMEDGFALFDPEDRLVMCNRRYQRRCGIPRNLMRPGTPFETLLRTAIAKGRFVDAIGREEEWIEQRLAAFRGEAEMPQQRLLSDRWVRLSETRTPEGFTVSMRIDVTELENARIAAEEANRSKTNFLNNVSHELRTPLTVVLGYTPFLAQPERLPHIRKLRDSMAAEGVSDTVNAALDEALTGIASHAGKIQRSSQHLLKMVNEILDWAKIEHGELDIAAKPTDAAALVREIAEEFRPQAEAKGLEFDCQCACGTVVMDPVRLRQVLYNLVGNALKFTTQGHIRLSAECRGTTATFTVEDSGCGIEASHKDIIFERFRQIDGSCTRQHGGTGLGLAIAKHIVELHGGTIGIESVHGEGSRFTVVIPDAALPMAEGCQSVHTAA